jgi:hypothetical protein
VSATTKSLQDQIREIRKLIEDAEASLGQARWALQTLEARLGQEDAGPGAA